MVRLALKREMIAALFDYKGDVAKNGLSENPNSYHTDYSPNNIRRVVLSPNGVLVQLHCGVQGYGKNSGSRYWDYVMFNEVELYTLESDVKWKPLLDLLSKPVCSSIEEIIFLSQPMNGVVNSVFDKELQINGLVAGYRGAGSDVQERIKNRYGRLRYFTIIGVQFGQFVSQIKTTRGEFLSGDWLSERKELEKYITSKVELSGVEDWFKHWGNQSAYRFDSAVLKSHFEKIRKKYEDALKQEKVDKFKEEKYFKEVKELEKYVVMYNKLYRLQNHIWDMSSICREGYSWGSFPFKKLRKYKGMPTVETGIVEDSSDSMSAILAYNKDIVNNFVSEYCDFCTGCLIEAMSKLSYWELFVVRKVPIKEVIVPGKLRNKFSEIMGENSDKFVCRNPIRSIANTICIFCLFFLDRDAAKYMPEYTTQEYWERRLKV